VEEIDMLKLQNNQVTHKLYNLASNLLNLHHSQMDNMIHDIGRMLSNTNHIEEASLQTFRESAKKHWFINFQRTTVYQLVLMTASMQDVNTGKILRLTHSQKLSTPRFVLDKPHDVLIQWIENGFQNEPPYDSIEAYSYALQDLLEHIVVSKMNANSSMLTFQGHMLSIRLAIALFTVFKYKPANVKGEAPFDMVFTMHTQHIPSNDMMLMIRRMNEYVETVIFRYNIKIWNTRPSYWSFKSGVVPPRLQDCHCLSTGHT